MTKEIIKRR